jgi:hypothetical protein
MHERPAIPAGDPKEELRQEIVASFLNRLREAFPNLPPDIPAELRTFPQKLLAGWPFLSKRLVEPSVRLLLAMMVDVLRSRVSQTTVQRT